ncbi:hypothetical protein [Bacillus sp. SJS]|uniref:hypothetical protein n=1 Tax=Bacillus sp. SJS TaxID=1423321 RepID=UPI0004DD17BE|nr:hypothetical protein [Bacillus sp. SJS]KZZ85055.1 hypothetical protein AS29_008380 [Bacillus sp. SJS]
MEKEEGKELDWFIGTLAPLIGLNIHDSDVSSEGVILFKDEVMDCFVPAVLLRDLPEKLLFETMIYEHEEGTEWIGAVVMDSETREWYLQVLLKDGEAVIRQKVDGGMDDGKIS